MKTINNAPGAEGHLQKYHKGHWNKKSQKGQLSIFLGVVVIIIFGLLAFVVNVGLFVKAKINLQNAVDAAAWSGAAVQSRRLTQIAYLNWELRNNYKEWMFKTYVLGEVSLRKTNVGSGRWNASHSDKRMNFHLQPFTASSKFDAYNIPSLCIHYQSDVNICEIYDVPGAPRFPPMGIPGLDDVQRAFLDAITTAKGKDCAKRSLINQTTSLDWSYGVPNLSIVPADVPVATGRVGAWPGALELALRIRNLEALVNLPPFKQGICSAQGQCPVKVDSLNIDGTIPIHERPVKAFHSAIKNLGGAIYTDTNPFASNEIKRNFTLYELGPNQSAVDRGGQNSLSTYLIPNSATSLGYNARMKYYLDLQILPINMATFFTTFMSTDDSSAITGTVTDAACVGSKVATPVPGYIFGFLKNPEIMTYYAVKGETKFIGLFYPFTDTEGITMKAYASAKPFGGRIGPKIFSIEDNLRIKARDTAEDSQIRSYPFVSGIQVSAGASYQIGQPVPTTPDFWATTPNETIGGVPSAGTNARFVIPNMIYEVTGNINRHISNPDKIQVIRPATSQAVTLSGPVAESGGLYDQDQFLNLANSIVPYYGTPMNSDALNSAIVLSRRPTKYEALNYLIPTKYNSSENIISVDFISEDPGNTSPPNPNVIGYKIFAPLYGPRTLYSSLSDINSELGTYVEHNLQAVNTYLQSLAQVANSISASGTGYNTDYTVAARMVHDNPSDPLNPSCLSSAGQFNAFFSGRGLQHPSCSGVTSILNSIQSYWGDQAAKNPHFPYFFNATYVLPKGGISPSGDISNETLMTAYLPGPKTGATNEGQVKMGDTLSLSRRNYYSTKFIPMGRLLSNSSKYPEPYTGGYISSFMDGNDNKITVQSNPTSFLNTIDPSDLADFKDVVH